MNRKETAHLLLAATVATSVMTLFSYGLSRLKKENFIEPELLGKSLGKIVPIHNPAAAQWNGWALHYLVGVFWVWLYKIIFAGKTAENKLTRGIVFGFLAGISAAAGWHVLLQSQRFPPKIRRYRYYAQLVAAHMVFGMITSFMVRENKKGTSFYL